MGIDENGEEIPVSDMNAQDVENASPIERRVYYKHLFGYHPANSNNKATVPFVKEEIIEFVESKGERFFQGKDDAWLLGQLGRPATPYVPCRRTLVHDLRTKLGYSYSSHQNALRVGSDVSISLFFNDFFVGISI